MLRCLLLLCLTASAQAAPDTVILVRHAEKAADGGRDPALSEAGRARAEHLADALLQAGVGTILVSPLRRTGDTAAPLSARIGVAATVVPFDGDTAAHVNAVARQIRAADGTLLVVGHSNTVTAIIAALGAPPLPPLCETSYGQVFVLSLQHGLRLQRWRYGGPDPAPSGDCL